MHVTLARRHTGMEFPGAQAKNPAPNNAATFGCGNTPAVPLCILHTTNAAACYSDRPDGDGDMLFPFLERKNYITTESDWTGRYCCYTGEFGLAGGTASPGCVTGWAKIQMRTC